MKITGMHKGDLVLDSNLELHGMVCGRLVVSTGCAAKVWGMVTGHLTVEKGGTLTLHGMASKGVTNNGGRVDVYGFVIGSINELSGVTIIHPGAKIE